MHTRDTTHFQSCWRWYPGVRTAWFPVQGSRVKSVRWHSVSARMFLIQCCIPFSEITFFLVSMGHNLAESIVAMWPFLEPSSRGEGSQAIMGLSLSHCLSSGSSKIPILFCPSQLAFKLRNIRRRLPRRLGRSFCQQRSLLLELLREPRAWTLGSRQKVLEEVGRGAVPC